MAAVSVPANAVRSLRDADPLPVVLDLLPRLVRIMQQAIAGSPGEPLALTQFKILKRIAQGVRQTAQLARQLDLSPATISNSIEALVHRGLVERLPCGEDRRVIPLRLTDAGRRALAAAQQRQREVMAAVLSGLTPEEAAGLQRGLVAIRGRLDRSDPARRGEPHANA